MNSIYRQTEYLTSANELKQLPNHNGKEVAFAGRSNAGKSSALNVITDQKRLAKISRTPGRTQLINYFQIDSERFLVDLPGYGYAKVPERMKRHWKKTLQSYLETRESLVGLILVMDIRHPLQALDWQMINWCNQSQCPLHILLTKTDKVKRGVAANTIQQVTKSLEEADIEASLQLFSAHTKQGMDDAHSVLDEWYDFKQSD